MENIDFNKLLLGIDSDVCTIEYGKIRSINFDNAATTPPFRKVIDAISDFGKYYGSIGRGAGQKAEITTRIYNEGRKYILEYFKINDKDKYTVVYVNNTTDGINKLARTLIKNKEDIVICTRMEHHSNDLPWRRACRVDYVEVDDNGRLLIDQLEEMLIRYKGKVKYVTVTGASNVTGYVNNIHEIAAIAHKYNSKIIVDGAQLVPHREISMTGRNAMEAIDFLVFSAHKLYAPFGAGAIVGLKEELNNKCPGNEGGGTVNFVMDTSVQYLDTPEKDEAGTPNYFGVVAMITALYELRKIGMYKIDQNEMMLKDRLIRGLKRIPRIIIYGDKDYYDDSLGIVVFNIGSIYHQTVVEILAKNYGISVRQGWFCCHPYCRRLMHMSEKVASTFIHDQRSKMPGMIRVSFGIYNTVEEVDYFLDVIERIEQKNR